MEVLNDVNGELVNLYRVVRHHLDELVRMFRWSLVSRQMWEWSQMERPETLTDVQRAARFFYLQKLAFGGKVHGQNFGIVATGSGPRLNLLRIEEELSAAHIRLANVIVEHGPCRGATSKALAAAAEPSGTGVKPTRNPPAMTHPRPEAAAAADAYDQLQVWDLDTLAALARRELDLPAMARRELAARGVDGEGRWIGFEAAAAHWEK